MKKYLSVFFGAYHQSISNRNTILFTIISGVLRIFMYYYLWEAVYKTNQIINGFTWKEIKTYIFASFIINSLLSFYTETKISEDIRSGDIVLDLIKPLDYQKGKLFETLGTVFLESVVSVFLVGGVAVIIFDINPPATLVMLVVSFVSVIFGTFIKFLLSYLTGLLCFKMQGVVGIIWVRNAITDIFSGALIPLDLYPDTIRNIISSLPFKNIVYNPVMIYMNKIDDVYKILLSQIIWSILLWLISRLVFRIASRELTINGG